MVFLFVLGMRLWGKSVVKYEENHVGIGVTR